MILYRIARKRYIHDLSGQGGLLSAARWHDHLPVIYASVNSSTCILEKLVHMHPDEIHHDLEIASLFIPDNLESELLLAEQLPVDWRRYPAPEVLKRIGNAWLLAKTTPLLFIPSVIDPLAQNVLINPLHPDAVSIRIEKTEPFTFDERLSGKWPRKS